MRLCGEHQAELSGHPGSFTSLQSNFPASLDDAPANLASSPPRPHLPSAVAGWVPPAASGHLPTVEKSY